MRKFKFEKLVRDKIKDLIIAEGNTPNWHPLSTPDYISELKKKINEENLEIQNSKTEELINELADLQEVINSLVSTLVSKNEFNKIIREKKAKSGGYKKKIFVHSVEAKDDSDWINYYLSDPKRFPEIK